jgi:hypothetical protein
MAAIIGLMAATRLRPERYTASAAVRSTSTARLAVMHSKHGNSRQIPLHPTTVDALGPLSPPERDRSFTDPAGARFFLTASGGDLTSELAAGCFRRLVPYRRDRPGRRRPLPGPAGRPTPQLPVHTFCSADSVKITRIGRILFV